MFGRICRPFARAHESRCADVPRGVFLGHRKPVFELLEERRLLAIDTLPADLRMLATALEQQLVAMPIIDRTAFNTFELVLKQQFTDKVTKPVIDFLDLFNPVPDAVGEFLDKEVLNKDGVKEVLDKVEEELEIEIPRTPRAMIATAAMFSSEAADLNTALDKLSFFFSLNSVESAIAGLNPDSPLEAFDALYLEILPAFGISLPFFSELNTLDVNAGNDPSQLSALATNVIDTLNGGGSLPTTLFTFSENHSIEATLFDGVQISPFGFDAGVANGGAQLNVGTINALIDYSIAVDVDIADGFRITEADVTTGIEFGAKGTVGVEVAGHTFNAIEITADLSGNLVTRFDADLDLDGDGWEPSELIGQSCWFETDGNIRFTSGGKHPDPPLFQKGKKFTIYDVTLWSAQLNSCDPAMARAASVMDGMLFIEGTPGNDVITVALDDADPSAPRAVVDVNGVVSTFELAGLTKLTVDALSGNDMVTVSQSLSLPATLFGREGMDTLLGGGGDDEIFGGQDDDALLDGGLGDDSVHGEEGADLIRSTAGNELLFGGTEGDIFEVTGSTSFAAIEGNEGDDTLRSNYLGGHDRLVRFIAGAGSDLIELTGGGSGFHGDFYVGPAADAGAVAYRDPQGKSQSIEFSGLEPLSDLMVAVDLTVHASASDDIINVVNGPTVATTQTTLVNFNGAFEEIRVANKPTLIVAADGRNDRITVNNPTPGAALVNLQIEGGSGEDHITVTPFANGVQVTVDGGPSSGQDMLNVLDSVGGRRVELRQDLDPESGSIRVVGAEAVFFSEIERLHPQLTGDPDLVVLKGDPFEPNDTLATAWFLGSGAVVNVDPRIDPGGDVDFFRFVADETGTLDFQVFFTHADGDINIDVRDAAGNVITSSTATDDDERITIPVVSDRTYFLRIFGASDTVENVYNFSVLNDAAPVPELVELRGATDSGRSNTDNVTFFDALAKGPASFDIVLDDSRIAEFTLLAFVPDTIDDDAPTVGADYGVEVFNNGVSIGFAFFLTDRLWRFTATAGDLGQGDNNHLSAAVWIRDRSNPMNIGRGELSSELQVHLDNTTPPVSFGLPDTASIFDGLTAASDTGVVTMPMTFADRITSDTTPTLWGRAEANTVVRLWLDQNNNGVIDPMAAIAPDVFLGQAVAVPFDGNDAYPDGYWEITTVLDVNEILGIPKDGLRRLLVTAEDVAGNPMAMNGVISAGVDELQVFIDTQGPQVTNVQIDNYPNHDLFDPKPTTNGYTPLVRSLRISVQDLPNRLDQPGGFNDFIHRALAFENAFTPQIDNASNPGNYLLVGDHVGTITIQSVTVESPPGIDGNLALATITLNFGAPLPDDRYTLTVRDNLVDPVGNKLDGESNAVEPQESPTFATGDGVPGGNFVARFTIDSRPELGSYVAQDIDIDINGNFVWDPANAQIGNDSTNVDLSFTLPVANADGSVGFGGYNVHDLLFAGKFRPVVGQNENGGNGGNGENSENGAETHRYFDQLAAYGHSAQLGGFRWIIDINSDGVVALGTDIRTMQPLLKNFDVAGAIPVAGNFDGSAANGDEIGLYNAGRWARDTNRNFIIEASEVSAKGDLFGAPIVGDFDGDDDDDLAVFNNNQFFFSLDGNVFADAGLVLTWGFPGVLDRPVAADMDQDGIDDIGLWVPRNSASLSRNVAEWYFLISNDPQDESLARAAGTINRLNHAFTVAPFGHDLFAEFGDSRSLPIVGNFDPPVAAALPGGGAELAGDYDRNGRVDNADRDVWRAGFGSSSNHAADGNHDGRVDAIDYVIWRNNFGKTASGASTQAFAASGESISIAVHLVSEATPAQTIAARDSSEDRMRRRTNALDGIFTDLGRALPARPTLRSSRSIAVANDTNDLLLGRAVSQKEEQLERISSLRFDDRLQDAGIETVTEEAVTISDVFEQIGSPLWHSG